MPVEELDKDGAVAVSESRDGAEKTVRVTDVGEHDRGADDLALQRRAARGVRLEENVPDGRVGRQASDAERVVSATDAREEVQNKIASS